MRYRLTAKVGVFFEGPSIPLGEFRWEWLAYLRAWLYLQAYPLRKVDIEIILPERFRLHLGSVAGSDHSEFGLLHDVEEFLIGYISPVRPEDQLTFEKARVLLMRVQEANRLKYGPTPKL